MSATVPASEPARQNGLPRPVSIEGYLQQIRAWASSQNPSLQDLLAYPKWLHGVTEALLSLLETHPQIRPSVEAHARS
ncbi:hypothetical protein LI90_3341 [Carbonactinospora thermoautotrophica]|uniref:Uncharacterized protein n=1 Tax=Carbonactinospora thermoautotrophica TaxID=1469144 RepID=A0A132MWM2_9ACTN|nr:hypothetical protein [Carbonactinospora thermoautotrophica]KWX02298.1 hypothetical protein LI90_3341 [Carbonactinospora thermoautotrophica]